LITNIPYNYFSQHQWYEERGCTALYFILSSFRSHTSEDEHYWSYRNKKYTNTCTVYADYVKIMSRSKNALKDTSSNLEKKPGFFFSEGSKNSVEDREQRERGSGSCCPLVRGSTQFANE
jgi:hypothetical protein